MEMFLISFHLELPESLEWNLSRIASSDPSPRTFWLERDNGQINRDTSDPSYRNVEERTGSCSTW